MENNKIIADFKNIKKYAVYANINERLECKEGLITLGSIDKEIMKMRLVRDFVLDKFTNDVAKTFEKYNSKDNTMLEFNPKKLFQGSYLDLCLKQGMDEFDLLVSKNKIEKVSVYSPLLDEKISQIYKYIEGLFRVLENLETANLLSNNFYDFIRLVIPDYEEEFLINGDGGRLSIYSPVFDLLNNDQQLDALKFFYDNKNLIFEKILFHDDKLLDNYRTNVSKRRALSIYKRG